MKKLLLLLAVIALVSCKDKPDSDPNIRDYTSFVFEQTIDNLLPNCVAGYFDADGYCWKIAELGDLQYEGQRSQEVIVEDEAIIDVFLFTDYYGGTMSDRAFRLKNNYKNILKLTEDITGIQVDKNNPKQYPQTIP